MAAANAARPTPLPIKLPGQQMGMHVHLAEAGRAGGEAQAHGSMLQKGQGQAGARIGAGSKGKGSERGRACDPTEVSESSEAASEETTVKQMNEG
eukprot:scaffold147018_cov12-Tisochrysis_lutea.AAC.1